MTGERRVILERGRAWRELFRAEHGLEALRLDLEHIAATASRSVASQRDSAAALALTEQQLVSQLEGLRQLQALLEAATSQLEGEENVAVEPATAEVGTCKSPASARLVHASTHDVRAQATGDALRVQLSMLQVRSLQERRAGKPSH
jgi:hypothetical protein